MTSILFYYYKFKQLILRIIIKGQLHFFNTHELCVLNKTQWQDKKYQISGNNSWTQSRYLTQKKLFRTIREISISPPLSECVRSLCYICILNTRVGLLCCLGFALRLWIRPLHCIKWEPMLRYLLLLRSPRENTPME